MTAQVSSTAKAPVRANNPAGDGWTFQADLPQVEVRDGVIVMWLDGRFGPVAPYQAWSEWLWLSQSRTASTRQRAAAIRAALNQIGYLQ